jgi:peroxiredoxin
MPRAMATVASGTEDELMPLSLGSSMPEFTLPATDGKTYSAQDLRGDNATVVLFWCNHCPYVKPNQDRVIALQSELLDRGVRFAAICTNNAETHPADGFEAMKQRAAEKGYNFPYLRDEDQTVARAFDAQRTPEAFLFDKQGKLRYHGRIDDNYEDVAKVGSHDLRNALEAILNGSEPDPAETGAVGCSIKWK